MTKQEVEQLFEDNVREMQKMDVAAGSMVRALISELERSNRNTYIRLRDAEKEGHVVYYDFVEGDDSLVSRIGRSLGFKACTDNKLEVRRA